MYKVWAFGCSHTEGSELGCHNFIDPDSWSGTAQEWNNQLDKIYKTTDLNRIERELSYSGQLAKLLGYELRNCGIKGSGADRALYEIYYKDIDWDNDIVLVGYTHIYRFIIDTERYDGNRNLNWSKDKATEKFSQDMVRYGPSDWFWSASNAGIYHMIKTHFPKALMIDTVSTTNTYKPGLLLDKITFNSKNLSSFSTTPQDKYPGGHFKEYTHAKLEEHIYEKLND